MSLRVFRNSAGVEWQVWSVLPGGWRDGERRRGYDRRSPDPVFLHRGQERRAGPDRRKPSVLVSPEMAGGWLVFECPSERRRLVPVPPGWDACPDAELERMCARARPVAIPRLPDIPQGVTGE